MSGVGPPKVVVVGSVHMDFVASAPRLPLRGETLPGHRFSIHPGGKGGNQAVAAARQGAAVSIVARVGDDAFGRELRASLASEGVDASYLQTDHHAATGASCVLTGEGGDYASIIVPSASLELSPERLKSCHDLLRDATILVVQLEIAPETVAAAVEFTHAAGGRVVLNAAPVPSDLKSLPPRIWRNVDVLIVNRVEAEALSQREIANPVDARSAGQAIRLRFGAERVVVTLGGEGLILIERATALHMPGHRAQVVDTIGAGDALTGAIAASLARGESLRRAVELGNAAGALAVGQRGAVAAMPTHADTIELLDRGPRP